MVGGPTTQSAERRLRGASRAAVIFAGLLVAAPAAHAGWTAPRAVSPARPGTPALHDASVALGPQGRGSIIASHETPDGLGTVAQGSVRGGRVGRLTDVLAGRPVSYAPSPAGAAAFAVSSAAGVTGYFRDARAPVGPALGLSLAFVPVVAAINARGDAVLARGTSVRGAVAIVIRPRGGAPSAPIVISAPGATSLSDVAISARGHVAVVWSRDGVLEARVREPNGGLSPVAQLTPAGTQINEAHIAVDSNGVTDVAAIASFPGAAAVITARRPAGGVFAAPTVLGTGSRIERLAAVAAGRSGLVTWLRSETGPPPELRLSTRIHAAARRGDGALRPAAVRVARGGTATASEPRPALAPDGSAVIVSNFGGAVHVARRAPRRRVFSRPRVISTITGGTQPFTYTGQGPTVAAATGGRALVAWTNADGLLRVTPFVPRARDRSGRQEARPPRFRSTPPVLDITTKPATIRASVFCDRPCRVSILIRVSGSGGSTRVRARETLRHRGRVKIVEQISGSQDREIRDGTIRAVTTRVIVANRYGATVTRERRPL